MNQDNDQADFSDGFCAFLQSCLASVDAAELLLVLWRKPAQEWSVRDLAAEIDTAGNLSEADVMPYVEALVAHGLISRANDGRVRYHASTDSEMHVQTLARLYLERPVTLFRVIYALRDAKIKTFADAFRIWRA